MGSSESSETHPAIKCSIERHERIKRDSDAWALLEKLPPMHVPELDGEPGYVLELANCSCGSTLAREARR